METMLQEYKITLKETRRVLRGLKEKLDLEKKEMNDRKQPELIRREAAKEAEGIELDKKIWSSIVRDLEFTVKWLSTGRQPENIKGIDSLATYQKEKPFDPYLMQLYAYSECDHYEWEKERSLEETEKEKLIRQMVSCLSKQEKDILTLSAEGYSHYEIASALDMPRRTVSDCLKRSKEKILNEGWMML